MQVIEDIRRQGLLPGQGRWTMSATDLKPRLAELWRHPGSVHDAIDTLKPEISWICAADRSGALYYANFHNRSGRDDTAVLITFEADLADVMVDGRDFLFTLFQLGHPSRARPLAERLFGPAVLRYLDRAWATDDQRERIGLCKLAIQDDAVILAHALNTIVIGGRYRTRFCSAFLVRVPISPERIIDVQLLDGDFELPDAKVTLNMIR